MKMEGEEISCKDKIIVQSRDKANNNLDLDKSCSSSQVIYQFVMELLQQHRVLLQAV